MRLSVLTSPPSASHAGTQMKVLWFRGFDDAWCSPCERDIIYNMADWYTFFSPDSAKEECYMTAACGDVSK